MFHMFYMFLHYDVMNHRFITKIDELMNLFIIRQKSPKMSPTRVNFCAASSKTFPGHEEGAA